MEVYIKTISNIKSIMELVRDSKGRVRNKVYDYGQVDELLFKKYNDLVKFADAQKQNFKNLKFLTDDINFYYTDYDYIDAFGGIQSTTRLPLIGISKKLIENLDSYCAEISEKFYKSKSFTIDYLDNDNDMKTLGDFLFKIATHFLFYHESAHIIQAEHTIGNGNLDTDNTAHSDSQVFDLESHIKELDADQFASRMICKDILEFYTTIPEEKRSPKGLADLLGMALVGVSVLFHLLSEELQNELYLKAGTHPHHAIRIKNTIEVFNVVFDQYKAFQESRTKSLPLSKRQFGNVDFSLDFDRMIDIYVKVIVYVLESHDRFIKYLYNEIERIQEYLDEMVNLSKEKEYTLIARNIG